MAYLERLPVVYADDVSEIEVCEEAVRYVLAESRHGISIPVLELVMPRVASARVNRMIAGVLGTKLVRVS